MRVKSQPILQEFTKKEKEKNCEFYSSTIFSTFFGTIISSTFKRMSTFRDFIILILKFWWDCKKKAINLKIVQILHFFQLYYKISNLIRIIDNFQFFS